ncbi:MAG: ABC transporter substrate-binding protein [Bacillota bacterium]|nr:ABC transporter substrate-binding protein [Bacillota bacterium]
MKKMTHKRILALLTALIVLAVLCFTGCGGSDEGSADAGGPPEINGLTYKSEMPLDRADQFSVYNYEGGYSLIDIHDHQRFLMVPKGEKAPEGLPEDITVLKKPVKRIYLAATATMAMFCSIGALDNVRMSSIKESDWTFDEPREAMADGRIIYAGKYSAPDYETMMDEQCDLAIESTMIEHTPEVQEMIEEIDIPVLIDRSSYESDPMGRAEWIKLYGVLTDHEKEATEFFDEQLASIKELDDFENTGKTVAFFYFSTEGKVVVRSSTDYVPKMIDIAGGKYAFKDLDSDSDRSTADMSVETFYDTAKDADIIVYNSSIDGSVKSMADLLEKDPIMEKMKAVKTGNCWITGSSMYQRTDLVAEMILDFHRLITEDDPQDLKYITKLN